MFSFSADMCVIGAHRSVVVICAFPLKKALTNHGNKNSKRKCHLIS